MVLPTDVFPAEIALAEALVDRRASSSERSLSIPRGLVDFCSNDYLGFAQGTHPFKPLVESKRKGLGGATGSRLISGNSLVYEDLERKISKFHRGASALIFSSGYSANVGLLSSLGGRGSVLIYDELSHASIRDGARLAQGRTFHFRHNDCAELREKLKGCEGTIYVVVEALYSMDGDFAPLKEICELVEEFNANLIVDEAHSTGVYGKGGRGCVVAEGLEHRVFARVHTFGKAVGYHGAVVVGTDLLRTFLVNFARSFIYSTALPEEALNRIDAAYSALPKCDHLREQLVARIEYFRDYSEQAGIEGLQPQNGPIQGVVIPDPLRCRRVAQYVQAEGYDVRAILSPTVPEGTERIRVSLHAFNTEAEIEGLVKSLAVAQRETAGL